MMLWETVDSGIPRINLGEWVDTAFNWVDDHFGEALNNFGDSLENLNNSLADLLMSPDMLVMAIIFSLLAWLLRDWKIALVSLVGLVLVIGMDQWDNTMDTLALVFLATLVALVIGIPIGIAAARWQRFSSTVRPVMDLMQTMPAFVWLVPVVTLFGLGPAGGLVATVIFALPPGVRLTELGIRQVDAEVVEAGQAFGGTPRQILGGIQMPLAMPTVMAGVNQVIMLALSMAVVAGLIGGGGLGGAVISALQRLDVGLGFEAGLSVVILAIYLDRCTASVGNRRPGKGRLRAIIGRSRKNKSTPNGPDQQGGDNLPPEAYARPPGTAATGGVAF
ncbi:MAG: ABC transporter permease subunit [Nocardioides sp.]|nr:ABC transporter permease subunit [Nocardioides sp.]